MHKETVELWLSGLVFTYYLYSIKYFTGNEKYWLMRLITHDLKVVYKSDSE